MYGGYDSYTEKFKYRYPAADGMLHFFEPSALCHSATSPLVAYAFTMGLIQAAEELLDVLGTSQDDVLSYEMDEYQAGQKEDAHINRLVLPASSAIVNSNYKTGFHTIMLIHSSMALFS